jgi:pimeloyl-ACP methyl ester carboxylesterase
MKISTVDNGGAAIRFATLGEGDPLVLLHGFSGGLEDWMDLGYAEPLAQAGRQLVLIDARGHGGSSKPRDPAAYRHESQAGDVAAVLDALEIRNADLLGYSLGGRTALTFAMLYPGRTGRIAVGAAHPFTQSLSIIRDALAGGIPRWLANMENRIGAPLPRAWRERMLALDADALRAAATEARPDFSEDLRRFEGACLLYCGADDILFPEVARCAAMMPSARLVAIPGCNHITTALRIELVLPRLLTFFARGGGTLQRLSAPEPVSCGGKAEDAEEGGDGLFVTDRDIAPLFQPRPETLDTVAVVVGRAIGASLRLVRMVGRAPRLQMCSRKAWLL